MIRINRKGLRIVSGALIGAAIGAVIVALTPPWAWAVIAAVLSLMLIIDTDP